MELTDKTAKDLANRILPKVSIIMNCYNGSIFLKEAIESVLSQTYQNWELIFWDNQSTDNSKTIFEGYNDERLKYFYAPERTPLSEARNLAIKQAEGEWIAFLDCDDVWKDQKLELQISAIDQNEAVGIVYTPYEILVNTTQKNNKLLYFFTNKINSTPHTAKNIFSTLIESNFIVFSSVLIKKNIFNKNGEFSKNLVHNEDYEILLKAAMDNLAICIVEKQVFYRIHDANNSYSNAEINYKENTYIYSLLPESKEKNKALKMNYTRFAIFKIRNGFKLEGAKLFFKKGSIVCLFSILIKRVKLFCR